MKISNITMTKTNTKYLTVDEFFDVIPNVKSAELVPILDAKYLTEETFKKEWVDKNRACLIKNAVNHWPAMSKWKEKEYWIESCKNIEVKMYPHFNFLEKERQESNSELLQFHEAIERLYKKSDLYFSMPSLIISRNGPYSALLNDLSNFSFLSNPEPPRVYPRSRVFIYRKAGTAWHYHGNDETLLCQIKGAKKVVLFPHNIPKIKHITNFLKEERYLNGEKLDLNFNLKPFVANIEEGDALYIPPFWHHGVAPVDDEVGFSLAFCWKTELFKYGNFSNYLVRRMIKSRILPFRLESLNVILVAFMAWILYQKKMILN